MTPARRSHALFSAAQVLTSAKSFQSDPLLGSPQLNRWGLHAARVRLAFALHRGRPRALAARSRRSSAGLSSATAS